MLTHFNIAQPYPHERIHLLTDRGHSLEEILRHLNGHIEHVRNGLPFKLYLESFAVVARALACLTFHIDIGQKVHFNFDHPIALTSLATPTFDVKGEPPWFISACLRLRQAREPIADRCECTRIGGRIGARRAANWTLINIDNLVEMLQTFDCLTWGRCLPRTIQVH